MSFEFSDDNKRYHTLSYHNRHTYGGKVFKAVLDCGFTCPNIDGSRGVGGCTYCDGGSGYFTSAGSVTRQLERERERIYRKNPNAGIIAYFQSHTNTYAPAERLSGLFGEAAAFGVCGIAVATRADCLDGEKCRILAEQPVPVTVELGLQTVHDETARRINRCHDYAEFLQAYKLLKKFGLRVCVHIINGLPDETDEMMLETARQLGRLRPDGVKIHLLHVIRGTALAEDFLRGEYVPLEKERYVDVVVRQLELLPPETVIERITGDGDKEKLLAPLWSMDKISVLGAIDLTQKQRGTWQGRLFADN